MTRHVWPALAGLGLLFALEAVAAADLTAVRTVDGSNNSSFDPTFGQALTALIRVAPSAYPGDGSGATIITAPVRENPRTISNSMVAQSGSLLNHRSMSNYVWQWGQFLDHDIDLTESNAANGTADISMAGSDILGPSPMPFHRSNFVSGTGVPGVPREQVNQITAYIDASNVYGSDATRAALLRTGTGGKLNTRIVAGQEFLPLDGMGNVFAGDIRAAEQVGLTAMHTLFLREHNRLADLLAVQKPTANDEELYQTARKIIGAQIQAITYNEFLPALLGSQAPDPQDYSYDSTLNAQVANEFSTAFFRVGHTMLSSDFALVDNAGNTVGTLGLRDAFFQPPTLLEGTTADHANMDLILRGLAMTQAQEIDNHIVDDVRSFLFGPPGAGGLDLASLNIQRGRDHGLPDYNSLRVAYGLDPVTSYSDISSDPEIQAALATLYSDVNNIDAWVGALAEDHLADAGVGELIAAALVDQFARARDGDRFFYLADLDLSDPDILAVIGDVGSTRLSDIILRNTGVANLRSSVFFTPEPASIALWSMIGLGLLCAGLLRARRKSCFAVNQRRSH